MKMMIRDFITLTVFLTVLLGFGQVRAEEKISQVIEQEAIPEHFLAPQGPFKDKEAYEKASAAQDFPIMRPFQDWKIYYRSEKYYEVCKEDLKNIGNDNEKFLLTRCGMLMQGFIDGAYYIFIHYKAISASFNNELKPFCITEDISFIQMAEIFVIYFEKNVKDIQNEGFDAVILSSLRDKYPCPWQIEMKNK